MHVLLLHHTPRISQRLGFQGGSKDESSRVTWRLDAIYILRERGILFGLPFLHLRSSSSLVINSGFQFNQSLDILVVNKSQLRPLCVVKEVFTGANSPCRIHPRVNQESCVPSLICCVSARNAIHTRTAQYHRYADRIDSSSSVLLSLLIQAISNQPPRSDCGPAQQPRKNW